MYRIYTTGPADRQCAPLALHCALDWRSQRRGRACTVKSNFFVPDRVSLLQLHERPRAFPHAHLSRVGGLLVARFSAEAADSPVSAGSGT